MDENALARRHDVADVLRENELHRQSLTRRHWRAPQHVVTPGGGLGDLEISRPGLMGPCRLRSQQAAQDERCASEPGDPVHFSGVVDSAAAPSRACKSGMTIT